MDRNAFDTLGYCSAGRIDARWPEMGPEAPVRDVLAGSGWAYGLAQNETLRDIASLALGKQAHAVRANLFAKSSGANWHVPWHQDRVVCVRRQKDAAGFSAWSTKAGLAHANAPFEVLQRMVAIRLHLDPCPALAGPLEVVPGTHLGILSRSEIAVSTGGDITQVVAERGEALVMRPLLLHRSRGMQSPATRRVLHVEFACDSLPPPLQWQYW